MATEDQNKASSDPQADAEAKARKRKRILWVIIGLLVLLNGSLGYLYFDKSQEAQTKEEALIDSEDIREQLENELENYEKEVKQYKGEANQLDSLVTEKEKMLEEKAERIRELTREKQITASKYKEAQEELQTLRYYTKKYQNQIDSLYRVNEELQAENKNLKTEVRQTKREKDRLKDQKVLLENKVEKGARLQFKEIKVTGVKVKNNGDEKETTNTNQIDKLKFCMNFSDNPIAEPGERNILIKLLNPKGETIFIQDRGSGEFKYEDENSLYTFKGKIEFENKDQMNCLYWTKGGEFEDGVYNVEIFTDGYKIGSKEFELKSGLLNLF